MILIKNSEWHLKRWNAFTMSHLSCRNLNKIIRLLKIVFVMQDINVFSPLLQQHQRLCCKQSVTIFFFWAEWNWNHLTVKQSRRISNAIFHSLLKFRMASYNNTEPPHSLPLLNNFQRNVVSRLHQNRISHLIDHKQ